MNTGHEDTHRYVPTGACMEGIRVAGCSRTLIFSPTRPRRPPTDLVKAYFTTGVYFVYARAERDVSQELSIHFVAHAP
ncbi:hypothetical protein EVAR_81951_1 [Eumeta japonica]|uniref:Uncharacterized protein n=1 Tax=Eumeta variegata TaxID=151549 RepID=A0A4C1ZCZ9_EUMVA|nr:hypothetical protein EVAR_81951_1 [Eumeta japonica]